MSLESDLPPRRKAGRPKKVAAPAPNPMALIPTPEDTASRVVYYLTHKLGRAPTNPELLGWAKELRSGADAIDAFVARGGVDLPVQEPKAPPSKISPKPKVKKAKGEKPFQFADRQPNAVCEACDTPGHTAERCPENA